MRSRTSLRLAKLKVSSSDWLNDAQMFQGPNLYVTGNSSQTYQASASNGLGGGLSYDSSRSPSWFNISGNGSHGDNSGRSSSSNLDDPWQFVPSANRSATSLNLSGNGVRQSTPERPDLSQRFSSPYRFGSEQLVAPSDVPKASSSFSCNLAVPPHRNSSIPSWFGTNNALHGSASASDFATAGSASVSTDDWHFAPVPHQDSTPFPTSDLEQNTIFATDAFGVTEGANKWSSSPNEDPGSTEKVTVKRKRPYSETKKGKIKAIKEAASCTFCQIMKKEVGGA